MKKTIFCLTLLLTTLTLAAQKPQSGGQNSGTTEKFCIAKDGKPSSMVPSIPTTIGIVISETSSLLNRIKSVK